MKHRRFSIRFLIAACLFTAVYSIAFPAAAQDEDYSAELPRIAPLEPAEALKAFQIVEGYRVELVAAEPLVTDPVAIAFDERGRLYVCEMRGYSEDAAQNLGRIRLLTDTDGDGQYDHAVTFLDGLSWPTALACWDGGLFVGVAPDILYCKDTDGDGKADEKRVVFTGFGTSNVQGLLNSFQWSLDNRIHGATSSNGGEIHVVPPDARPGLPFHDNKIPPLNLRGRDFAIEPRAMTIEPRSGGAQHGLTFDNFGRKFVCSNSDHLQMVMYEDADIARNPYLQAPPPRLSIAADGPQAEVFRISPVEPWRIVRTRLRVAGKVPGPIEGGGRAAGYFTGSTGVTIYRGDAWPSDTVGHAFIGDVGSNIVHRKRLEPDGVAFKGVRIDEKREFLASTDIWFRPVQFANAPDGTLWVIDMYREVIEHPHSLPPIIKKHLDLTSGRDRGRLWRIVPTDSDAVRAPAHNPKLDEATAEQLVATLAHPNGWHRDTAARLIYQRQDRDAVEPLKRMLSESKSPIDIVHALYALRGLGEATEQTLWPDRPVSAAIQGAPAALEHYLRLLGEAAHRHPGAVYRLYCCALLEKEPRIRFAAALAAGQFGDTRSTQGGRAEVIGTILEYAGHDPWIRTASLSSVSGVIGQVFDFLGDRKAFRRAAHAQTVLTELAHQAGRHAEQKDVAAILKAVAGWPAEDKPLIAAVMRELTRGLTESHSPLLAMLKTDEAASKLFEGMIAEARVVVVDADAPLAARLEGVETLRLDKLPPADSPLAKLLSPDQPVELQKAAVRALAASSDEAGAAKVLLAAWPNAGPAARNETLDAMLTKRPLAEALLEAVEDKRIDPAAVSADRVRRFAFHRLGERAANLFAVHSDRQQIIDRYLPALQQPADAARGKAVFAANCAICHQVGDLGKAVGPSIATFAQRGPDAVLISILDPNREINPQFIQYLVTTTDGTAHVGMIAAETAASITLQRADGMTQTIVRSDIASVQSLNVSLMPVGLEAAVTPQQMADLIAFLSQSP